MDKKRYNELILLSQRIHEYANQQLKEYLEKTYAKAGAESMGDQLEDWLYVAEESCVYMLGNAVAMLDPEVRDHDPEKALFAGADGLDFYRRISEEAPKYLKPGGKIYLELGYTQAEAVSLLLFQNGFSGIRTVQDLSGKDRVVRADLLQETEK